MRFESQLIQEAFMWTLPGHHTWAENTLELSYLTHICKHDFNLLFNVKVDLGQSNHSGYL